MNPIEAPAECCTVTSRPVDSGNNNVEIVQVKMETRYQQVSKERSLLRVYAYVFIVYSGVERCRENVTFGTKQIRSQ